MRKVTSHDIKQHTSKLYSDYVDHLLDENSYGLKVPSMVEEISNEIKSKLSAVNAFFHSFFDSDLAIFKSDMKYLKDLSWKEFEMNVREVNKDLARK